MEEVRINNEYANEYVEEIGFEETDSEEISFEDLPRFVAEAEKGVWDERIESNGWIDYTVLECSICGFTADRVRYPDKWNFCPGCGKRMERGK